MGLRHRPQFLVLLFLLPSATGLARGSDPTAVPAEEPSLGHEADWSGPDEPAASTMAAPLRPSETSLDLPSATTPTRRPPSVPGRGGETVGSPRWWSAGLQSTYVLQRKAGFNSAYTGPNSLLPTAETGYTLTATVFLGLRPWAGAELFFQPETIQSQDLSHLSGLGGLSNGENQKGGGPVPTVYRARAFLRQTIALGGELSTVDSGANQLGGPVASRRLVVTAGNFAWADVFDNNAFSHDPRTQFLNWAFMSYGASDYAADLRGYTWGIALEYYHDDWAFRVGRLAQPKESNGLPIDFDILRHYGDSLEVEHGYTLWGQPGKFRVAGFHNFAKMGSFRDALRYATANGGVPDVANVRRNQSKYGFGVSLEQNVLPDVGIFARFSYNDGQTETYAFAEIERSLTAGVSIKGQRWHRDGDTLGIAWAANGLSDVHRAYLGAGGLGFLIGDGRIDYRPEQIFEAYYSFNAFRGFWFTVDVQHIANPAYNADRGPVNVVGCRLHAEY